MKVPNVHSFVSSPYVTFHTIKANLHALIDNSYGGGGGDCFGPLELVELKYENHSTVNLQRKMDHIRKDSIEVARD